MAQFTARLDGQIVGDLDAVLARLDDSITRSSATAKLVAAEDLVVGGARTAVRVYERFSMTGGNRLSLTFCLLAVGEEIALSAVTAGGSQGVLLKLNTFGEEAFLEKAREAVESLG